MFYFQRIRICRAILYILRVIIQGFLLIAKITFIEDPQIIIGVFILRI